MAPGSDDSSPAAIDTASACDCGNPVAPGDQQCQWCEGIEVAKNSQTVPHTWQTSRLTNTKTCSVCGLLPLDPTDTYSDCPGPQ